MRVKYAIAFVSDMQRAVAFYRDVIGLPLKFESDGWTEFATEGATLALHVSEGSASHEGDQHHAPGSWGSGISVPDLDAFHSRMIKNKVRCLQEPRETFGARIV